MWCLNNNILFGCLSALPQLYDYASYGPLLLRLALAAVFIVHGYPKLFAKTMPDGSRHGGITATAGFFESIGIRPAKFLAVVVGVVEFFGGILLIAGFGVQIIALLLAINMLVAIWKVKFKMGFAGGPASPAGGWEFDFVLLIMALSLLVLGPGAYALDLPL
ncbi:MAG TPA: DoxX family protein [Candidatus Paceibacterota bacterium]